MNIDRKPLDHRVDLGILTRRKKGDLLIYNYTQKCQWDKLWDKHAEMARGLILKEDGTVVARPFPKFFNINERPNTEMKSLPVYKPEITEKLDGSLGILYKDLDGLLSIATRGAFDSEQAVWATKWLRDNRKLDGYKDDITYLFEIIYPMNRIVVNYGQRAELVLIGMVHNWTGKIYPFKEIESEAKRLGFGMPKLYDIPIGDAFKKAEDNPGINEEGFVAFYPTENLQIKIKLRDYLRLHRLTFGISVKAIWENMKYGQNIYQIFNDAPDEAMKWITHWELKFQDLSKQHEAKALEYYNQVKDMPERRDQALWLQANARDYLGVVFGMIDKRNYKKAIFDKFRPSREDSSQTFRALPVEDI